MYMHLRSFYLAAHGATACIQKEREKTSLQRPSSPSPTTASVVAPGSGLPRDRRTLSGTPRPDAQVHQTAGTAAPPVRVSTNRPLAGPRAQDRESERERCTEKEGQRGLPDQREKGS